MPKINNGFSYLTKGYLFATQQKKVNEFSKIHPNTEILRLGIGDVTLPLCPSVIKTLEDAVKEQSDVKTFKGYPDVKGYAFYITAVQRYYAERGIYFSDNEIFATDGAKSSLFAITNLFSSSQTVLISDPVYPAYLDANLFLGRKVVKLPATRDNGFLPLPPKNIKFDIAYLCSPNNPTGATYSKEQLSVWVKRCKEIGAIIIFDSAYERYVCTNAPRSIYEVEGAKEVAIEICSLSKSAGFTGLRCGYTIIPNEINIDGKKLSELYLRYLGSTFNGVSYIVQRAGATALSKQGLCETQENIAVYKNNAYRLAKIFRNKGLFTTGETNSPYVWVGCPKGYTSNGYFEFLLQKGIVVTSGAGFGEYGEGYIRISAFCLPETVNKVEYILR